ncbi:putative nuclear localization signal [Sesbania bispinosa]|nr:putative nuclear localization signal [Sesbania bispinosa]
MAQVEKGGGDREKSHVSTPMNNFPRDLLKRFNSVDHLHVKLRDDADAAEEVELTLGLSSNGRFGVDPNAKKIKRASSIPEFVNVVPMACTQLMRTCSLPTETEEEWRKRKELQMLRRMEARRKRYEKQKNLKALRERNRGLSEEVVVVEGNHQAEKDAGVATLNEFSTPSCGVRLSGEKGSGSQRISESECQPDQGTKSWDARSPVGANSLLDSEQKLPATSGTSTTESSIKIAALTMSNKSNNVVSTANRTNDIGRNMLEDMPCVSTKGEGPNGKRIEGFLYRYRKGEEVRILCVCHGSFLTPAEFVKHAGGGDVAHPLKHIVVNPSLF